jgi:RNA polymerase sigma-70 factor, ECF subfamily
LWHGVVSTPQYVSEAETNWCMMRLLRETETAVTEDFALIRAIQAGDHQAFELLVRRYQRQVANLIYVTMGGSDDVEDIAQEVFIRVYRSLPRFKFDASFFSWIYRITMNLCIDEIRKRKIRKVLSLDFLTEDALEKSRKNKDHSMPSDSLLADEKRQMVQSALQKLKPEHRDILVLREYQDLGYNEIAETLNISLEAVKSRIFRARLELKKLLREYFEEQP